MRSFASVRAQTKTAPTSQLSKNIRGKKAPELGNIEAHEAWLWSQDPSKYTLQLLGTQNVDKLKQFIKQHQLRGKVVYYHTRRDNQDWYALVYGVYPKNTDARTAVNELPPRLKKLAPWVRNFSAIHAEMGKPTQ
jgi:septal ring-binding cell division protein DamX